MRIRSRESTFAFSRVLYFGVRDPKPARYQGGGDCDGADERSEEDGPEARRPSTPHSRRSSAPTVRAAIMRMGEDGFVGGDRGDPPRGQSTSMRPIGIGGIPRGPHQRDLRPPSRPGKTTVCLHVIANAQRAGRHCRIHRCRARARRDLRAQSSAWTWTTFSCHSRTRASRRSRSPRCSYVATRSTWS